MFDLIFERDKEAMLNSLNVVDVLPTQTFLYATIRWGLSPDPVADAYRICSA